MNVCNKCGKEISDNDTFCPFCGTRIEKQCFCCVCGEKISANTVYCPKCGAKQGASAPIQNMGPKKDRVTTALLGIFLGAIGIHYFYLGKTTAGLLTILISACSCGIWSIVMFIQSIIILTMTDSDFEAKYVTTDKSFPLF